MSCLYQPCVHRNATFITNPVATTFVIIIHIIGITDSIKCKITSIIEIQNIRCKSKNTKS